MWLSAREPGWDGRVGLCVCDTLSHTVRDWVLPVTCLRVSNGRVWWERDRRDKCRRIPAWPETQRRRPGPISLEVLRHTGYLMSNDGVWWLSNKVSSSQTDSSIKFFHNQFTHFPCHHYGPVFLKRPFFLRVQCHPCKVQTSDFSHLFSKILAMKWNDPLLQVKHYSVFSSCPYFPCLFFHPWPFLRIHLNLLICNKRPCNDKVSLWSFTT